MGNLSQADISAIQQAATNYPTVPIGLLYAIQGQETGGESNPDTATSSTGAMGLFQVLPSTAQAPGYGVAPIDPSQLTNPYANANFAAAYLAGLQNANGGNLDGAVSSYSGGSYTLAQLQSNFPNYFNSSNGDSGNVTSPNYPSTSNGGVSNSFSGSGGNSASSWVGSISEWFERGFVMLVGIGFLVIGLVWLMDKSNVSDKVIRLAALAE